MASASSSIVLTNLLGLDLNNLSYCTCGLSSPQGVLGNSRSKAMTAEIELVLNKRYSGFGSSDLWAEITAAAPAVSTLSQGVTYLVRAIKGSSSYFYIGKTVNTMKDRYKGGISGGLKTVLTAVPTADSVDISIYYTSNPALLEGWCYVLAQASKMGMVNIIDPA